MARYMKAALPWLAKVEASHVLECRPFVAKWRGETYYLTLEDTLFIPACDEQRLALNMMRLRDAEVPAWLVNQAGGWNAIIVTAAEYAALRY